MIHTFDLASKYIHTLCIRHFFPGSGVPNGPRPHLDPWMPLFCPKISLRGIRHQWGNYATYFPLEPFDYFSLTHLTH